MKLVQSVCVFWRGEHASFPEKIGLWDPLEGVEGVAPAEGRDAAAQGLGSEARVHDASQAPPASELRRWISEAWRFCSGPRSESHGVESTP